MGPTVLSDASRAPGGGRGCQAHDNPARGEGPTFAALSSTESGLVGYVGSMAIIWARALVPSPTP